MQSSASGLKSMAVENVSAESTASSRLRPLTAILSLVSLPVIVLDQFTKHLISSRMELFQSISVIDPWLDITYTLNPGAAFSLFLNAPPWFRTILLFTLSATAIVVLLYLIARNADFSFSSVAMALILAGATGNLIDRIRLGRVVDFIHVHYGAFHYPIFNVADSAITIGVIVLLAHSLLAPRSES